MPGALITGFAGLGLMIALIALRMPIAYAMIMVGAGGTAMLSGPAVLVAQLKTLAYGQFAVYDLRSCRCSCSWARDRPISAQPRR